ncbi:methionyl-tRNA formyltransferase [Sphingomicrobium lutaoense]|uniref:Methionyl-tRNA formyltransferase n=2 Tax=Sphingomicrobium lutaoense TaxID=515949 RepID=A0A839Z595_9SPHN|nr:methionyl-tRNA formyltransferase [Sphingomicrobium lutaoense]
MAILMRVIMMGSPDFAVPTLNALVEAGHEVICVYCQPPRPAGRGKKLMPTAMEQRAHELGFPVRSPTSLKSEAEQEEFADLEADVAIVAAYGLILPKPVLDAPRLGCVNVHASLLPRWRGAAPVQRAIMAGDAVTGVTLMQMEEGLDTGPMILRKEIAIDQKNAAQLTEELAQLGAMMVVEWAADPDAHDASPQPDDSVTYARKISKEEARIDWERPAAEIQRHIQGLSPFPGAWTMHEGERLKLLAAEEVEAEGAAATAIDDRLTIACGDGAIRVTRVQRAGKGAASSEEMLRGYPITKGARFS